MQVVVPVKSFNNAKKRLASVLTAQQRRGLMKYMLDDVLSAIAATPEVEAITVVTSDSEVAQWVGNVAPRITTPLRVFDPGLPAVNILAEAGLRHAYSSAAADLISRGASTMLLLPADIPLVTKAELQELFAEHTNPGVSIAAAGSDGGTNALLVSPPNIIAPAFGVNSCQRHGELAREHGLQPVVLNTSGLDLDIDTVADLRTLLAAGRECATLRYLLASGIADELEKSAEDGPLQDTKHQQSALHNQTNRHVG